jgi:hypothetical protein
MQAFTAYPTGHEPLRLATGTPERDLDGKDLLVCRWAVAIKVPDHVAAHDLTVVPQPRAVSTDPAVEAMPPALTTKGQSRSTIKLPMYPPRRKTLGCV